MQEFKMGNKGTDESLAEKAQKGDGVAAEELLQRYKNAVRARARKYFFEGFETDDLVQEGMIGLYAAIGDYKPSCGKSFKNFAYLCVTRRIVDVLRAAGKQKLLGGILFDPDTLTEGYTPEYFLLDEESRAEFRAKLMGELSDFEFRVVTYYLDGMSYAQICEATGKDFKSVDNALARSKRKLMGAYGLQNKKARS